MNQKKLYPLALALILITLVALPLVAAQFTYNDYIIYNNQAARTSFGANYDINVGGCRVQNLTGDGHYLKTATFKLQIESGCTCQVTAVLMNSTLYPLEYSSTNVYTPSLPSGDGTGSYATNTFNFSSTQKLNSGEAYYIGVITINNVGGATKYWYIALSSSGSYCYRGNGYGSLTTASGYSIIGSITTTDLTPFPAPIDFTGNQWMQSIAQVIVPLLMMLIPAFFGWKFAKAWGFFAGINVGVILCYVFMNGAFPLWGVIMMLVVDGLLLFGKVGFRT